VKEKILVYRLCFVDIATQSHVATSQPQSEATELPPPAPSLHSSNMKLSPSRNKNDGRTWAPSGQNKPACPALQRVDSRGSLFNARVHVKDNFRPAVIAPMAVAKPASARPKRRHILRGGRAARSHKERPTKSSPAAAFAGTACQTGRPPQEFGNEREPTAQDQAPYQHRKKYTDRLQYQRSRANRRQRGSTNEEVAIQYFQRTEIVGQESTALPTGTAVGRVLVVWQSYPQKQSWFASLRYAIGTPGLRARYQPASDRLGEFGNCGRSTKSLTGSQFGRPADWRKSFKNLRRSPFITLPRLCDGFRPGQLRPCSCCGPPDSPACNIAGQIQ